MRKFAVSINLSIFAISKNVSKMQKNLIMPCYGVVCGNTPILANEYRAPKVGFYFTL